MYSAVFLYYINQISLRIETLKSKKLYNNAFCWCKMKDQFRWAYHAKGVCKNSMVQANKAMVVSMHKTLFFVEEI